MKVTVKRCIADEKRVEMSRYHLAPVFDYVDYGTHEYYANIEAGTVTLFASEVIRETEKAVQFNLLCETEDGRAHGPYKAWFPKTQIIDMEG